MKTRQEIGLGIISVMVIAGAGLLIYTVGTHVGHLLMWGCVIVTGLFMGLLWLLLRD